ncbi:MAG TPA: hypothetical protein VHJ38_13365 [Nitrososphaeraceae archaeon]|jgi:hypothetical protein|nr:hypothetical protein [Nitrososphaeraceae archaeon]
MNNKIIKIDPEIHSLLQKTPKKSFIILSNVMYDTIHFIKKLELLFYIISKHPTLGDYSILIISLETNKGTIIMKYDEGYRGENAFDNAIEILTQYSGLSSLINRALIELDQI